MLDLDLDQQLRDEFRSTADRAAPSARLDGLVRDRIARRQMQRRLTLGGGAALALALVVGVGAALTSDTPDAVVISPTDSDSDGGSDGVNADAEANADLDTEGGASGDVDVTGDADVPTVPDPTSIVPPVDGTPGLPGTGDLTGTYAGSLTKAVPSGLPRPGCQIETSFDRVLSLADGSIWNLHGDYCVAGVGSTGTGTFTTDLPNGDTMTGDVDIHATGSGVGLLTITGGTGAYANAAGTCQLDGWGTGTDLTTLGTFHQQGTFSCAVTGVASH